MQPGLRSAPIGCGRERSQWGEGSGQISSRAGEGWLLACPPGPDPSRASGSPEHRSGVWASQAAGSSRERGRREAGQLLTDNGLTTPRGGKRKQRIDSFILPPAGSWGGLLGKPCAGAGESFSSRGHKGRRFNTVGIQQGGSPASPASFLTLDWALTQPHGRQGCKAGS